MVVSYWAVLVSILSIFKLGRMRHGSAGHRPPATGKYLNWGFYLAGENNSLITLSRNTLDYTYPNMSHILVLGCQGRYGIEALTVGFLDTNNVLYREPFSGWNCPQNE
jgi:hypothetical protein